MAIWPKPLQSFKKNLRSGLSTSGCKSHTAQPLFLKTAKFGEIYMEDFDHMTIFESGGPAVQKWRTSESYDR